MLLLLFNIFLAFDRNEVVFYGSFTTCLIRKYDDNINQVVSLIMNMHRDIFTFKLSVYVLLSFDTKKSKYQIQDYAKNIYK